MSFQYDQYLARHRANVKRGFDWLSENLPGLMTNTLTAGWNTEFAHDQSKNEPDEYEAYDAYFYGNNRSYEVVQRYQMLSGKLNDAPSGRLFRADLEFLQRCPSL